MKPFPAFPTQPHGSATDVRRVALLLAALLLAGAGPGRLQADPGFVRLSGAGTNAALQVIGDPDDDWQVQGSEDLVHWTDHSTLAPLRSGAPDQAPTRLLGGTDADARFFRVRPTAGLYDPTVLRTMSLTFTQANWPTLLANGRTTGSNTVGTLVLDNGTTNTGVGARYKGNTSYTGFGGSAPTKKSLNIEFDFVDPQGELMGYETVNLNNAYADETILREALYFNVMRRFAVCPQAAMVKLHINGSYWGLYSLAQQGDGDLVKEWFPSNDGDRWRTPNAAGGTGGPGGGGGFTSGASALTWQGSSITNYRSKYELKTDNSTNAWERLVHVINVLNNSPADGYRDTVEEVLAVDRWLWFLAVENVFADDDSYWNKGADYSFYFEPESGRIHPIEHDGNEGFTAGDTQLSPVIGSTGTNRPVIARLLGVPELRQRYLAHMRTILREAFHPDFLTPMILQYSALTVEAVAADTRKGYTMTAYTNDLTALRSFVTNRYRFLTNHAELKPLAPDIQSVTLAAVPTAGKGAVVTARVEAPAGEGIDSVWLYHRAGAAGRFQRTAMWDDGQHGDGTAGDGVYGGETAGQLAGTRVRYYVEARSGNAAKAASFSPSHAEEAPYTYRVVPGTASGSVIVLNELQSSNSSTLPDPQGQFDDWIELRNLSAEPVDLAGMYLSDNPDNPRKWAFPAGTVIPAGGYLLVWADEDGADTPGLHASFKLSGDGEQVTLVDTDARQNALLDSVTFGPLATDTAYGRTAASPATWQVLPPTPGAPNP